MMHEVTLPDGTRVSALGAGTWHMGEEPARRVEELDALGESLRCGVRLIDTAEMYGDGAAEELVGEALRDANGNVRRDELFVVSKVLPTNAGRGRIRASLSESLERLGLDYLDLYLLHWRGDVPLAETIECMEELRSAGLIRRWGVSNFDMEDMDELMAAQRDVLGNGVVGVYRSAIDGTDDTADSAEAHTAACATNQVLYHLGSRGVEVALKPWMTARRMPMMAYCPLAQGGTLTHGLMDSPAVTDVAKRHDATPAQVLLAWAMRDGMTIAIPKASTVEHARQNARAAALCLDADDLAQLDAAFPAPRQRVPLDWL